MIEDVLLFLLMIVIAFGIPIAIWLLQRRYGSYRRWIYGLEKSDIEKIKAAHDSYNLGRVRGRPEPPSLYKKRMFTDSGIAVYQNGLIAKFCVGPVCKYRFVQFGDISGIYPVKLQGLMDPMRPLPSRKGLQIETADKMTFIVDSAEHDLIRFRAAMEKAMMGAWDRVYKPDEVLWRGFGAGNAYVHETIRSQRPPTDTAKIIAAMESPAPKVAGKGSLLLEQSEADMVPARARYIRWGAASVVGAPACFIAAWLLLNADLGIASTSLPLCALPYFLISVGFLLALMVPLGLLAARVAKPFRLYENGIEMPYFGGKTVFRSWGEFIEITELKSPIQGELYIFRSAIYTNNVSIPKNTHNLSLLMPEIKKKIGKAENVVVIEKPQDVERRKTEYLLYFGALISSAIVGVFLAWMSYRTFHYLVWITGFGLFFPPIAIIATTLTARYGRSLVKNVSRYPKMKVPAVIIVAILAYFVVSAAYDTTIEPYYMPSFSLEPEPPGSSMPAGTYENSSTNVTGFIYVKAGETFIFRNSRLTMNLSYERQSGIRVAEGGKLILDNVTLTSSSPLRGYTFEILGVASITDSSVTGLWGDWGHKDYDGGLEIYSSHVTMNRVHIANPFTNGLLIVNANPIFSNSTIESAGDDGIEMRHSNAIVTNNTIRFCARPMMMAEGSGPTVKGNDFLDNFNALFVDTSHPTIKDNMFVSNSPHAIEYDYYSKPIIENNSYSVSDDGVVQTSSPSRTLMCDIYVVAIAIACLLLIYRYHKEGIRLEHARLDEEK